MAKLLEERALIIPVEIAGVSELPFIKYKGHWDPIWGNWKDKALTLKLENYCPGHFTVVIKPNPPDGEDLLLGCLQCKIISGFKPLEAARRKLNELKLSLSKCIFNAALEPKGDVHYYFESDYVLDSHKRIIFCFFTGAYSNKEGCYDLPVFLAFIPDNALKEVGLKAAQFLLTDTKNVSMEMEKKMKEILK